MKIRLPILFIFGVLLFLGTSLTAQDQPFSGMNYQGLARDISGDPLPNQPVWVRLSFTGTDPSEDTPFYSELHQVVTDDLGLFRFIIGHGESLSGSMQEIPWASENIWMDLAISGQSPDRLHLLSRSELQTVPYAFYAESTNKLVDDKGIELRNAPSIYWTIGGNAESRPPFHFIGNRDAEDLVIKTNMEERLILTSNGQVQLIAGVGTADGAADDRVANYPLFITGSEQGIYIKVNNGRDNNNNFMTFADGGPGIGPGTIWGRIEGQTVTELTSSDAFVRQNVLFALKLANLTANTVGLGIKAAGLYAAGTGAAASLIFAFAAPGFYAAATAVVAQAVVVGVELAALATQVATFNSYSIANAGVYYTSGAGDYAEYIKRHPEERDILFGEIIGIRGGVASLQTGQADHVMVVSNMPAFLGNAPNNGTEESMEKVAFLGQVPVRVVGPVSVGDFILPSGNNDGMGIAYHRDDLPAGLHDQIVGVAWEAAEHPALNIVNCAVGLHKNQLADEVQVITDKVDAIEAYLRGEGDLSDETIGQPRMQVHSVNTGSLSKVGPLMDNESFDQFVEENRYYLETLYGHLGQALSQKGMDISQQPVIQKFIQDPVQAYKDLRRDPAYQSYWGKIDQIILKSDN